MKLDEFLGVSTNELPLENIKENGGYTCIFQTIACIGDSLSSGEFEYYVDESQPRQYIDKFEYSWGQFIAKMTGSRVYNFSRGGMSAKEYMESFAESLNLFDVNKKADAYIIALGVNDLFGMKMPVGTIDDIDVKDYSKNKDTFAGWYGRIISKYKEINPQAKFFFLTMPKEIDCEFNVQRKKEHYELLHALTKVFKYSYVIDLYKYAPIYDESFKGKFYLHGHMNPAGYKLTAIMVASYIDFIIRSNFKDFKQVGFAGTKYYLENLE